MRHATPGNLHHFYSSSSVTLWPKASDWNDALLSGKKDAAPQALEQVCDPGAIDAKARAREARRGVGRRREPRGRATTRDALSLRRLLTWHAPFPLRRWPPSASMCW